MMARTWLATLLLGLSITASAEEGMPQEVPASLTCTAMQTAGFHDFPNNAESYEPVAFYEGKFTLQVNRVLMRHINPQATADLYMTLRGEKGPDRVDPVELNCHHIRGTGGARGLSCTNLPPAELVLINLETLRYTRTSIGGWTFAAATDNTAGDSIYVEYGTCRD
ncbi:MAG: hypothetical protein RJQ07_12630 [Pseudomonadales bacterium]